VGSFITLSSLVAGCILCSVIGEGIPAPLPSLPTSLQLARGARFVWRSHKGVGDPSDKKAPFFASAITGGLLAVGSILFFTVHSVAGALLLALAIPSLWNIVIGEMAFMGQ
jgi:hypothetical protein